jgi:hypothetical protein
MDQLDPLGEVNRQGQGRGMAFTTRSGELRVSSTGSGMCDKMAWSERMWPDAGPEVPEY